VTGPTYEQSVIALVCWKQMKSELYRGMISFACLLRNRANQGWFGGSMYQNAVAVANEEGLWGGEMPDAREMQFQMLLQAIEGVFDNAIPDKTGGALYFAHRSAGDKIAGERTAEIGQYIFFRGLEK
jgi:hypothetical protein